MRRSQLLGAGLLLIATLSFAQVGEIAKRLGLGTTPLSDSKISSGLKQALQIQQNFPESEDARKRLAELEKKP